MNVSEFVVRSIDVGHGNTKFTTQTSDRNFGTKMYPSIAPQSRMANLSGDIFSKGDCVEVPVKNAIHIVGKDAGMEANSQTTRMVDKEYCLSNVYMALVRGALTYMAEPAIDLLVLGLPLTTYQSHHEQLREAMVGGHTIFNPHRKTNPAAPEFMSVEVKAVRVVPQPVGAFFNYAVPNGKYEEMSQERNLVIDVGYGTVDWFVSDGSTPIKSRCGANQSGISIVVNAVADRFGNTVKNNFEILNRIDRALRDKKPFKHNGEPIDLMEKYWETAENAIRESVASMLAGIGDLQDIDNILLTGGGSDLFFDEIVKAIPTHKIIKEETPVFSNVRGFQMLGEHWGEAVLATQHSLQFKRKA